LSILTRLPAQRCPRAASTEEAFLISEGPEPNPRPAAFRQATRTEDVAGQAEMPKPTANWQLRELVHVRRSSPGRDRQASDLWPQYPPVRE